MMVRRGKAGGLGVMRWCSACSLDGGGRGTGAWPCHALAATHSPSPRHAPGKPPATPPPRSGHGPAMLPAASSVCSVGPSFNWTRPADFRSCFEGPDRPIFLSGQDQASPDRAGHEPVQKTARAVHPEYPWCEPRDCLNKEIETGWEDTKANFIEYKEPMPKLCLVSRSERAVMG